MSDQERYIQILERENAYLRTKLQSLHGMLVRAYLLAGPEPDYVDPTPEEREARQHRIEEVLGNGNT